jgi:hypothetical protein
LFKQFKLICRLLETIFRECLSFLERSWDSRHLALVSSRHPFCHPCGCFILASRSMARQRETGSRLYFLAASRRPSCILGQRSRRLIICVIELAIRRVAESCGGQHHAERNAPLDHFRRDLRIDSFPLDRSVSRNVKDPRPTTSSYRKAGPTREYFRKVTNHKHNPRMCLVKKFL